MNKLGTIIKSAVEPTAPPPRAAPAPPPPPVIPTSYFTASEQRLFFSAIFGLVEITKLWDTFSPRFITDLEPTWSSGLRIQGLGSVVAWTAAEITMLWLVGMLRIPMLSPSYRNLAFLAVLSLLTNGLCWFIVEPSAFLFSINVIGPASLGSQWFLSRITWLPTLRKDSHLEGVHRIRLLPHSTATLNPLSLTYCIPPDSNHPLYIPIVFNNSAPEEVSYFVRSLETGHADVVKLSSSQMKKSPARPPRLRLTEGEDDAEEGDLEEPETDPYSALVLASGSQGGNGLEMDVSRLPSVKPPDSMALVPRHLAASQSIMFITVDKPSLVTLKSVVDKRGDRFQITPHREAVIIECPTGGGFVDQHDKDKKLIKWNKPKAPELRCVGEEEVVHFQARGVGPLRVAWKKKSGNKVDSGVIEGIEEDVLPVDDLALIRRDRVSKTHTVPLRVNHDQPGDYTLFLTSVTDALHNTYSPSGPASEKSYNVLSQPSVRLDSSAMINLLHGEKAKIPVEVVVSGALEQDLEITYSFKSTSGDVLTKKIKMNKKREDIVVSEPGTYTLMDVEGVCVGGVMEPSSIVVQMVPLPTMDMSVTTLHEWWVTARSDLLILLEYTEQRKGARARTLTETFNTHHGSVVLRPEHEGEYTYTFVSLSDKRYRGIKLDKAPIKQTVHPLAYADLSGRIGETRRHTLYACSGDEVTIDVDARGIAPLKLAYLKSWSSHSENITIPLTAGRSRVSIPVPRELSASSGANGKLIVALLSIEDGNGCVRKLSTPAVEVDIKRQKPTARFAKSQKVTITEGEVAKAALRLTGNAPWEVTYSINGRENKVTLRDPNNHLKLDQKGTYKLIKVKDAHCPGDVLSGEETFEVDFKPRPAVSLQQASGITKNRSGFVHKGLCAGQEQQVALRFAGQAPFELGYRYTTEGRTSKHVLKSAQETGILHLATEPGHHRYDFVNLVDGNYPSTEVKFSLEHDVHTRPSVSFAKPNSRPICLDSPLHGDAKVQLSGVAPFKLYLSIRKPASTTIVNHVIPVAGNDWILDIPIHEMKEIGRHEVMITRVEDSSGCEQVINEYDELRTVVEVVESAKIVAVDNKTDLCVGDSLDFLLQGKAPWTIEYDWLGRTHKVSSSASRFTRFAEEKGTFEVRSVALKDNQCKRQVSGLVRTVHPLPSAKIKAGEDSLREGDDPAVFSVHFTGLPPFSFTYTRSEQVGSRSRVVETQTITDIWDNSYTISSSLPGDYAVTAVSDKFCRYPPITRTNKKQ
ncbi:hypothetical protein IAU60_000745 [Kwoniella sp. DSM 27419]